MRVKTIVIKLVFFAFTAAPVWFLWENIYMNFVLPTTNGYTETVLFMDIALYLMVACILGGCMYNGHNGKKTFLVVGIIASVCVGLLLWRLYLLWGINQGIDWYEYLLPVWFYVLAMLM